MIAILTDRMVLVAPMMDNVVVRTMSKENNVIVVRISILVSLHAEPANVTPMVDYTTTVTSLQVTVSVFQM